MSPEQLHHDFALPRTRSLGAATTGESKAIVARKKLAGASTPMREKFSSWPVDIEFVVEAIFLSWLNFYSPQRYWPVSRIVNGQAFVGTIDVESIQHMTELASACSNLQLHQADETNRAEFAINMDASLADEHGFTLALRVDKAAAKIILDYDLAAIDEASADILLQHLSRLFETSERTTPFKNLDLLSADEKELLIRRYNKTAQALPLASVTEALRQQASAQPNQAALIYQNRTTNFAELYKTSGQVSTQLQLANASQVVGVLLPRSDLSLVALLGIWRAGRTYLALPVDFPAEQLAHMCAENNVAHIITSSEVELPDALTWASLVYVDQLDAREVMADKILDMDDTAAVMYTSGSTGMPKGVRHSLRSLLNRFGWWLATYPAHADEIFSQRTAVSFIPSLWEMVSGIVCGKPLVVISDLDARSPESLMQLVRTHKITRLAILPSFLRLVLNQDNAAALSGLRYLVLAGEPVSGDQLRNILAQLPDVVVINDYGCTEVNGILSCDSTEPWKDYDCLPAGRPIANCQAFILNPAQQMVPVGVIGELYLDGAGVSEGYVGLPQLNREKFIELDLGDGIPRRLYRTADRAKRLADGRIQILGRNDNVVKIRGIRIELEGVEHALLQLPEIAAAAAVCQKNGDKGTRLLAYVVAAPGQVINSTELLQGLAGRLPDAMLPNRIVVVESLPKTANGKLNRAALFQLANSEQSTTSKQSANSNQLIGSAEPVSAQPDTGTTTTTSAAPEWSLAEIINAILPALADTSGIALADINLDAEFRSMGVDSANAVMLMESLSTALAKKLPVTLIYECATPRALATHIFQQQQSSLPSSHHHVRTQCGNIAVVGMACRMPQADNLESFWKNLLDEKNCITEIPAQRWHWQAVYSSDASAQGKTNSRWGGFINGIDEFDPLFFNISASEAKFMAPEQRILLQACWHAIEDAGYAEHDFYGRAMGVFIGARPADYMERLQAAGVTPDAFTLLGNDSAILAARIAYYMNLKGPVITVDTACSSSAVAIHMACESLRRGESEIALAGGVSLVTMPSQYIVNTKAGMVSPDGSCKTFDQSANGFVQGEGCGVLLLKPLEQALADNDRIYAVIHASGINQDGKTNGITAPNGDAQMQLINSVYRASAIDPQAIDYVEAHGTGTKLGDPIEFNALNKVFSTAQWQAESCALGSVKTNIGHLIAAAGVAGFIKVAQSLYHKKIPANLHYQKTNEHIDIENSPFFVNASVRDWVAPKIRMAALSSFGFSGTNCHLVLREAPAVSYAEHQAPAFIVLSAKDQSGLLRNGAALKNWLEKNPHVNLAALAYSYARRLNRFKALAIFTAQTYEELVASLDDFISARSHARVFRNDQPQPLINGRHFNDLAERLLGELQSGNYAQDTLDTLASLMVGGVEVDVKKIFSSQPGPLLSLPGYVFEKGHYWVEGKHNEINNALGDKSFLHSQPARAAQNLVAQLNRDTAGNPQWIFTFNCAQAEFSGHKIGDEIWWPAAAQIQALQVAIAHAGAGNQVQIKQWQLLNPLVLATASTQVELRITQETASRSQFEFIAQQVTLSKGLLRMGAGENMLTGQLDLFALAKQCRQPIDTQKYYADFASKGIHYGLDYRRLVQIRRGKNQLLGWVSLPQEHKLHAENYQVELLDAALHSLAVLQGASKKQRQVPVAVEQMLCLPPLPAEFGCYANLSSQSQHHLCANLWLFDKAGNIFAWFEDIQLQTLASETAVPADNISALHLPAQETLLYSPRWFDELATLTSAPIAVRILGDLDEQLLAPIKRLGRYHRVADLLAAYQQAEKNEQGGVAKNEVLLWSLSATQMASAEEACWSLLDLVRQLMQLDNSPQKLLIACTHRESWSNHLLALSGAVQALKKEYPQFSIKIVQALNPVAGWIAQELCDALWQADAPQDIHRADVHKTEIHKAEIHRSEIHRIGAQRLVPVWSEYRPQQPIAKYNTPQVSLITGGLGGVGSALAKYLSRVAGSGLVLVGRRSLDESQREFINELRRDGAEVVYWQTDVSDSQACVRLVHKITQRFGQLDNIYHCAGVTRDAFLINKTRAQVDEVMAAKVRSCENLDNASAHLALKHFVLFSSISAVLGTLGQTDYGTANAWLDNFARNRNQDTSRAGHCLSVNWPLWAAAGMRPDAATETWLKQHMGMHAMPTEIAFATLQQLLADKLDQAMVLYGERKKLMQFVSEHTPAALAQVAVGS